MGAQPLNSPPPLAGALVSCRSGHSGRGLTWDHQAKAVPMRCMRLIVCVCVVLVWACCVACEDARARACVSARARSLVRGAAARVNPAVGPAGAHADRPAGGRPTTGSVTRHVC